jgi:hypothetical protein
MYTTDITGGELSRQRIADLHAQADRQRQARNLPTRSTSPAAALRQLATTALLAAVPVAVLLLETAGVRYP